MSPLEQAVQSLCPGMPEAEAADLAYALKDLLEWPGEAVDRILVDLLLPSP